MSETTHHEPRTARRSMRLGPVLLTTDVFPMHFHIGALRASGQHLPAERPLLRASHSARPVSLARRLVLGSAVLLAVTAPRHAAAQRTAPAPRDSAAPGADSARATAASASLARPLSLEEALRMAGATSQDVAIATAGVTRSRGQLYQARSDLLPQIAATAAYTRALRSEFQGLGTSEPDTTGPPPEVCGPFTPDTSRTVDERLDFLEQRLGCSPFGSLGNLPFGRANTYRLGLSVSQNIFTGGRALGNISAARAGTRAASIALTSARAQALLDVTQAYYDAALSDRLVAIADSTLSQAEATLSQTRLAFQVGTQPEFELLSAQVTAANQRPIVIQRRTARDLAYLRLRQLLQIPLEQPLALTTELGDTAAVTPAQVAALTRTVPDTATASRAPVRQAAANLEAQQGLLRVARSERLPQVSINSQYGRVAYPAGGLPGWNDFRTNWNVGVSISLPIFLGGRIRGDELVAEASVADARARYRRTEQLAALDTRSALAQLEAAQATFAASAGTAEQATRAYSIATVRYREGISTQTELAQSRLLLQQAEANRAQAARDLQVARVRIALLRDLPLAQQGALAAQGQAQQQMQQQPLPGTTQPAQPQSTQPLPQAAASTTGTFGVTP